MPIIGLIGSIAKIGILWSMGTILVGVGLVLAVLGSWEAVGGRLHYS